MLPVVFIVCAVMALIQTDTVLAQNSVTVSMSGFTSGADGLRVIGTTNSNTGYALSEIGDFNSDGTNDFVISARTMRVNSVVNAGMVILVLGHSGNWTEVDLSTVASGATMMRIYGSTPNLAVGTSVGGAGDVNGDGRDDLLISAPYLSQGGRTSCGAVFVIFGSPGPYSDVTLSSSFVAGSVGYAIFGPSADASLGSQRFNTIGMLSDVNGDGFKDFVVSAYQCAYLGKSGAGCVWIIYGSNGTPANIALSSLGSAGVLIAGGARVSDYVGNSIDMAGDFNNDGFPDLLIGANGVDPVVSGTTRSMAGAAYLLFGSSTFTSRDPNLANFVTGTTGVMFLGSAASSDLGWAVSGAGDVNGDGFADILIGAPSASSGNGLMYVVFGTNVPYTADVDMLTFLVGAAGYYVFGTTSFRSVGGSFSRAGDVNQDGYDDVLCTSHYGAGRVSILFGSPIPPTSNISFAAIDSAYSFTGTAGSDLGFIVSGGFDVNGDGIPDIMMGAPDATVTPDAGGSQRGGAGAAYVVMGPFVLPTNQPTSAPSAQPSGGPTTRPSGRPSSVPSMVPSSQPSSQPLSAPTAAPSAQPSRKPSAQPYSLPTSLPTAQPSARPSVQPTRQPSSVPSAQPSTDPTTSPSVQPSSRPSRQPTNRPTSQPSSLPTFRPSAQPTTQPSSEPTSQPSSRPSAQPSAQPSSVPTHSAAPTAVPTVAPSTETRTDSDGSSPALSDGGIAGVVVGGFLFLILLIMTIALGVMYCSPQGAAAPAPAAEYEMTQVQEA